MEFIVGAGETAKRIDLHKELSEFFAPEDLEVKPGVVSKKTGKAMLLTYVTNRAIQERLDQVVGPGNWRNDFRQGPDGGVLCGIGILVNGEWVWKWDGAENTDIESVKGGLSGSMKRAAVQWGIGRYLYKFPSVWVQLDDGKYIPKNYDMERHVPAEFLPAGYKAAKGSKTAPKSTPADVPAKREKPAKSEAAANVEPQDPDARISRDEAIALGKYAADNGTSIPVLAKLLKDTFGKTAAQLTYSELAEAKKLILAAAG